MDKWLKWLVGLVVVWVLVLVGVVIKYGQEKQMGLEMISKIPGLNAEIAENDKFRLALEDMEMDKFWKIRWELVNKPQAKVRALGEDGQVAFSMDFKRGWLGKVLVIKMYYGDKFLEEQGEDLAYVLARDMLAYAHLVKTGNWEKGKFVQGLRRALDWAEPRLVGGDGWIKISRN